MTNQDLSGKQCPSLRSVDFHYGNGSGISDVSFRLRPGRPLALLGRNGAGKSTIIKLLVGALRPIEGHIDGVADKQIGYLPEERGLYPQLSVEEHLFYFARLGGIHNAKSAAEVWMERLGLVQYRKRNARALSKGNAQKLQIGMCFVCEPEMIILDEPFSGLDTVNRDMLFDLLRESAQHSYMLISGHDVQLLAELCADALVIRQGHVVASGSVDDLRQHSHQRVLSLDGRPVSDPGGGLSGALEAIQAAVRDGFDGEITYTYPSLEDVYRSLTTGSSDLNAIGVV